MSSYSFNNLGRIGSDLTDNTQKNLYNTRFANYMLSDYHSSHPTDSSIDFAISQPNIMVNGSHNGAGIHGSVIDNDSFLMLNTEQARSLEKLQLMPRPFLTVPYLGKGSCDPTLESMLQQGELVHDKKSASTMAEKSLMKYALYPTDSDMQEHVNKPIDAALGGWRRGGENTRFSQKI
jgi:hypothetical protein